MGYWLLLPTEAWGGAWARKLSLAPKLALEAVGCEAEVAGVDGLATAVQMPTPASTDRPMIIERAAKLFLFVFAIGLSPFEF